MLNIMNEFFTKYSDFEDIQEILKDNHITENNFYSKDVKEMMVLLENHPNMINFICKYSFEKGYNICTITDDVSFMDVDICSLNSNINTDIKIEQQNVSTSNNEENSFTNSKNINSVSYKKNNLYYFLNKEENLIGRMILGRYENINKIDYIRLKEQAIVMKIIENKNYNLDEADYLDLRKQIVELFPDEDHDYYYVSHYKNENNESVGASGSLLNTAKNLRKKFREAKLMQSNCCDDSITDVNEATETGLVDCLVDPNIDNHSASSIITSWKDSFFQRQKTLSDAEKHKATLITYFKSFPCLQHPLGIVLLQNDFEIKFKILLEKKILNKEFETCYSTLFSKTWPNVADRIIEFSKSKTRISDVKEFLKINESLILSGKYNSLLALLILPLIIRVPKTFKINETNTIAVTKLQILDTFILVVKNHSSISNERMRMENWLRDHRQQIHPYVIIVGELKNITEIYLVLNEYLYPYVDPVKAVQDVFKCLIALQYFPYVCDYVWGFIQKFIFGLNPNKCYQSLTKFVNDIKKVEK